MKLVYPLYIKIPIQALATLLVAMFAFYVYHGGDPEMKRGASKKEHLLTGNSSERRSDAHTH
jgi:hypothetical protein